MTAVLQWLGGSRRIRAGRFTLRLLSAQELLNARAEADACVGADDAAYGLYLNAAIVARAAFRWGRPAFGATARVLDRLSAEEIEALAARYARLRESVDPSPTDDSSSHEALLEALAALPSERLKWRVLRSFSVLPSAPEARAMTDGDYLQCALHTILDAREREARLCPECRKKAGQSACPGCGAPVAETVNPSFDEAIFEQRRGQNAL